MKKNRYLGFLGVLAGAGFIMGGILSEGYHTVFEKASRICLECIGIG